MMSLSGTLDATSQIASISDNFTISMAGGTIRQLGASVQLCPAGVSRNHWNRSLSHPWPLVVGAGHLMQLCKSHATSWKHQSHGSVLSGQFPSMSRNHCNYSLLSSWGLIACGGHLMQLCKSHATSWNHQEIELGWPYNYSKYNMWCLGRLTLSNRILMEFQNLRIHATFTDQNVPELLSLGNTTISLVLLDCGTLDATGEWSDKL